MERNLVLGNIGEAFFRWWYENNIAPLRTDLVLSQFGYNPAGVVVGQEKVQLLKSLRRSPDFALFHAEDLGTEREKPLLGISINSQARVYNMWNARAPWLCYACARGEQEACYAKQVANLWYNRYNITNDYKGFVELFKVDVLLVSLLATWPARLLDTVRGLGLDTALLNYIREPKPSDQDQQTLIRQMEGFIGRSRNHEIRWLLYSSIWKGAVKYSIAGAPVNQGVPREVVCIDLNDSKSEEALVQFLKGATHQDTQIV